ncbi:MAG TPA: 4Fe-4S single cluster domain-containing protein [Pseudonocardiaceae bacterium]|nr:4Fe-4S single cluster domain-containing protein [Pseudonocardiaceae bacterium]
MTLLRLNRTHYPVTVLGPGVRAGIWVQGCTIGCSGCVARDTWDADGGAAVDVGAVLDWLRGLDGPVDGVTVSGGEPFQQPEALAELLDGIGTWRCGRTEDVDVLVYSGYPWSRLSRTPRFNAALQRCDAVIAGPYVARRNNSVALRGSDNQRVVALTALGERRYGQPESSSAGEQRMQVSVDGDRIYCIGIPRSGDMDRLTEHLADAGVLLEDLTWRA